MGRSEQATFRKMKRTHHNVYNIPDAVFRFLCSTAIALWILCLAGVVLRHLPAAAFGVICGAILAAGVLAAFWMNRKPENTVRPYVRQEDFEFLGLHDLKNSDLENRKDVLPRDEEAAYIKHLLDEVIFTQSSVKQALTLVGPSGCGKSTILSFFRNRYRSEYAVYDFSGNYHEFRAHLAELFGSNLDQKLSELTYKGKVVIILDQFERFFYLPDEEQALVRKTIQFFCRKNVAVIISMREEFLGDYLKRFDLNNLSDTGKQALGVEPKGILKELINILQIHDRQPAGGSMRGEQARILAWDSRRYKNNLKAHLDLDEKSGSNILLEQMGSTLLYCQSQKDAAIQVDREVLHSSLLESKCRKLFGEKGSAFYRRHADEPLIEQQIFFHMAEFNRKINHVSDEELDSLFMEDNNELLNRYYDIQLCYCADYFNATRVLYLLSQARTRQVSVTTKEIIDGLFPDQFSRQGNRTLMECIELLENLQLIRKNTESSTLEYEIAHDFIAASFLNYCSIRMNREVKNALDVYISELTDEERADTLPEKIEHRRKEYGSRYFPVLTWISMVLMTAGWLVGRFVYNPWQGALDGWNPYGGYVPLFPLLVTLISVLYLCCLFDKMVKYYRGPRLKACKRIYILLMLLADTAVWAYPHFLFLDGVDLALAAACIAFLLDRHYQESCRKDLRAYGYKSAMIGLVFAFAHVMLFLCNNKFGDDLIILEFIAFTILVGYATYAHVTQEYLYSFMTEAASEKIG